jgi:hypothetical protein
LHELTQRPRLGERLDGLGAVIMVEDKNQL